MLIVFEAANNHGGSLDRGKQMVDEFCVVADKFPQFRYAWKLQYRDIEGGTCIHPSADPDHPYVKRFRETNLSDADRLALKEYAVARGFRTACTPFDEKSVDDVVRHGYDILKVGSPSFADWPLWEKICSTWNGPIIASCGGATEEEIDKVAKICQGKDISLLHCISEYDPPFPEKLQMNQIDYLKNRYPRIPIGFSCHEEFMSEGIILALAKGVSIIEKHVCLEPKPNEYSLTPDEMEEDLRSLSLSAESCGLRHMRVPGTNPTQFKRQLIDGRMWWKP